MDYQRKRMSIRDIEDEEECKPLESESLGRGAALACDYKYVVLVDASLRPEACRLSSRSSLAFLFALMDATLFLH